MLSSPLRLQMITMQTVAIAIAMKAHPTVTVVRIAIKGTSESPEFDHFEPNSYNPKWIKKMFKIARCYVSNKISNHRSFAYGIYLHVCTGAVQVESNNQ